MSFWKRKKKLEGHHSEGSGQETGRSGSGKKRAYKRKVLPTEVKLLAVQGIESGLSVGELSEMLGAAPATITKWLRAYQQGGTEGLVSYSAHPGTRKIYRALEQRIEEYRKEHPGHGVRRISDELRRNNGIEVSAETVRRVVNDAGLSNPAPDSKRRSPQVRRFEREVPNALWQIDIFTFELKRMYRVYLVGIIDDHSRYIVGHGLYRQQKADAVMEVVRGAIGEWGAPREILSDNGRQFVAWRGKTRFQKVMRRQGVQHVRSAPHHPMTLGKIERFWRTLWEEFLEEAVFASFADASQRLSHWIAYYNHQRPHQGIDGACPADRFYGIAGDVEEALKHGCQDNSLRLALGQETRPPLYLLGKLGETDVRVTRKGDDIEVKLGDEVHELIRLGAPYEADNRGMRRGEASDVEQLERYERGGAVPGGGAGAQQGDVDCRNLPDFWGEPADADAGDGGGGACCAGGIGAEETGTEATQRGGEDDYEALEAEILIGKGSDELEDPLRGDEEVC